MSYNFPMRHVFGFLKPLSLSSLNSNFFHFPVKTGNHYILRRAWRLVQWGSSGTAAVGGTSPSRCGLAPVTLHVRPPRLHLCRPSVSCMTCSKSPVSVSVCRVWNTSAVWPFSASTPPRNEEKNLINMIMRFQICTSKSHKANDKSICITDDKKANVGNTCKEWLSPQTQSDSTLDKWQRMLTGRKDRWLLKKIFKFIFR